MHHNPHIIIRDDVLTDLDEIIVSFAYLQIDRERSKPSRSSHGVVIVP
jgi:hypothetical protein